MTANELRDLIRQDKTDGVFVFCGEEDYLKRYYLGELRRKIVTDDTLAPFVHFVFEGAQVDFGALADALYAPGMFSDRKLIEWHLADIGAMKEKEQKEMLAFCEEVKEYPGNCVVFVTTPEGLDPGTEKKPGKMVKLLSPAAGIVVFSKSTDAQLLSWITRHFSAEGLSCTPGLPRALLSRVGHSMDILANEIDKLCAYAKANGLSAVSEKEMEFVSVQTVESDAFGLSNAVLDGNAEAAFVLLGDMKRRKVEPVAVLGQLARLYGDMLTVARLSGEGWNTGAIAAKLKMHEYKTGLYVKSAARFGIEKLTEAVDLCAQADANMKNGASSYIGIERLIARFARRVP